MQKKSLFLVLFCCWVGLCPAQQRIFVDLSATGNNDGTTWQDAYTDLHDALDAAVHGDEIWVAEGMYRPSDSDRSIFFRQSKGIKLYGGFAGDETILSERDWEAQPTILDGDIGAVGDSLDNSYTVLYMAYPDTATTLDGFVIQNGVANNSDASPLSPEISGGGLFVMGYDSTAYGKVRNCIIQDNSTSYIGGGVMVSGQGMASVSPQFVNCIFQGNHSDIRGGAVYWGGSSTFDPGIDFRYCRFTENTTKQLGAAVFFKFEVGTDSIEFNNCRLRDNKRIGPGSSSNSAAIMFSDPVDTSKVMTFDSCEIYFEEGIGVRALGEFKAYLRSFNYWNSKGYNPNSYPVGSSFSSGLLIVLSNAILSGDGKGSLNVSNSSFENVRIDFEGTETLINIDYSNSQFKGSSLTGFDCEGLKIGHCQFQNSYFNYRRTNIGSYNSSFMNSTFILSDNVDSKIDMGSSIFFKNKFRVIFGDHPRNSTFFNSIIYQDGANSQLFNPSDTLYLKNSFINNINLVSTDFTISDSTLSNIDPLFLDTTALDFRLHPCSPLINAGTNQPIQDLGIQTDLDGNPRIIDGTVDIGPYESNHVLGTMGAPQITAACYGLAEGSVILGAQGGCPPYSLDWMRTDDGSTGTDSTALLAGDYLFSITDARGRSLEVPLTVAGSSPDLSISGDSTACAFTPNAFLVADISDASQPVDYQWSTGGMDSVLMNIGAGQYDLNITDANGCMDSASVNVTATPPVQVSTTVHDATGPTETDGAIQVTVTSGFPPYDYQWDNGADTDSISGLWPGNYRVTVVDANGCGYVFTYEVSWSVGSEAPTDTPSANRLFPNPAKSGEPITLEFSTADRWLLMDATGRVLMDVRHEQSVGSQSGTRLVQMALPCLPAGMYFWAFHEKNKLREAGRLRL